MSDAKTRRILMLTAEYGPIRIGGLGTMVESLCHAMDPSRFTPVVALPRAGYEPQWPLLGHRALSRGYADVYRQEHVEIWLLSNELLGSAPIYPSPSQDAGIQRFNEYGECIAESLAEFDADIVHLHDLYGYRCLGAARDRRLPSVYTVHRLHEDVPSWALAENIAAKQADVVTTVSETYRRDNAAFFDQARRSLAIPNGIDTQFWSLPGGVLEGRLARRNDWLRGLQLSDLPTFAYIGRFDAFQKGLDTLLDAWTRLSGPNGVNLVFLGEGNQTIADRIAAASRAAPNRIRHLGGLASAEEVRALLALADGMVLPSRFEPFGMILIEAMAMGAIPIASCTGGPSEIVIDCDQSPNGCGRLFPVGDAPLLAEALLGIAKVLQTDPEHSTRLRTNAVNRAAMCSARAMAARYEQVYDALLDHTDNNSKEEKRA